jgi:hypothetical protein
MKLARPAVQQPPVMTLYTTVSRDGGLTWSAPTAIHRSAAVHLCEPGFVRSPDGKEIAVLLIVVVVSLATAAPPSPQGVDTGNDALW